MNLLFYILFPARIESKITERALVLVNGPCGIQRSDGVVAIWTRKDTNITGVKAEMRLLQKLERRAAGVGLVDQIVEVLGEDIVAVAPHVDAEEEEVVHLLE